MRKIKFLSMVTIFVFSSFYTFLKSLLNHEEDNNIQPIPAFINSKKKVVTKKY